MDQIPHDGLDSILHCQEFEHGGISGANKISWRSSHLAHTTPQGRLGEDEQTMA